jgi:hypothetical protein
MHHDDHLGQPCRGEEVDCAWCGKHHTLDTVCQCACCTRLAATHPREYDPLCPDCCGCAHADAPTHPCGQPTCISHTRARGAA